ncbi:hypothetical protein LINPERPRIM_LOCUS24298 [Linum perenne]
MILRYPVSLTNWTSITSSRGKRPPGSSNSSRRAITCCFSPSLWPSLVASPCLWSIIDDVP